MAMRLQPFDKEQESWARFADRVDLYFQALKITDTDANRTRRRAILLQGMGIGLYNKFADSVGGEIQNLSFDEIVTRVEALVNPPPLEIYERYRFHNRRQQQPGENSADYMVALRKIAISCNFGTDSDGRLRDQFVCGLASTSMQKFLLQQPQLTIDNVVQLAQSFERADQTTAFISNGSKKVESVNAISSRKGKSRSSGKGHGRSSNDKEGTDDESDDEDDRPRFKKCRHCGGRTHPEKGCRFRDAECFRCKQKGHIPKICSASKGNGDEAKVGYIGDHPGNDGGSDQEGQYNRFGDHGTIA